MYRILGITTIISFCIMYAVMFLNMDNVDHFYISLTRLYMALLMVAPMVLVMLVFMRKMYPNKKLNIIISVPSIAVFILALVCLRSQLFISDRQYMRAMIPHHSSAIMTSKNANIKDPELKKLSGSIIQSQEREIEQMKRILKRLDNK